MRAGQDEQLLKAGYVNDDGTVDKAQVRAQMLELLRVRKVRSLSERKDKAVTRGQFMEHIFPDLAGPDHWATQDDPALAKAVWTALDLFLWGELKYQADAPMQRAVALDMGNGYVLCRTLIGRDRTSAVYITDDRRCIEADLTGPDSRALQLKHKSVTNNVEMLIQRQPKNAKRYERAYNASVKAVVDVGRQQISNAVTTAIAPAPSEDEAASEDDE